MVELSRLLKVKHFTSVAFALFQLAQVGNVSVTRLAIVIGPLRELNSCLEKNEFIINWKERANRLVSSLEPAMKKPRVPASILTLEPGLMDK